MVMHGFVVTLVGSKSDADKVAEEISKIPGVVYASPVSETAKIPPKYPINVVVEFGHKISVSHEALIDLINKMPGVHKEKTALIIIRTSYKKGKIHEKPDEY